MSQKEREPAITETLKSKFGEVKIIKFESPTAYQISLTPFPFNTRYVAELGEAASPEPVISDVTESIQIAGAPLDYQPLNTAHTEIMDQLKLICEGNDHRYVLRRLKEINNSMKPTKPLRT